MVRGRKNPLHYGLPFRLKKTREKSGLTRMALAQSAGASDATVAYLETNQRMPTVGTIARLASALGVTAPWLAFGLGEPASKGAATNIDDMGARLQTVRVEIGHTKASLACLIKVTPGTVADIEKGGQAKVQTIEALATVLGVSPGWLAYGIGDRVLPPSRRGRPPAQAPDPAG